MDKPFAAYDGEQPYVFVCYAHADAKIVYPEIAWLNENGANIWYDEGISPGKNWRASIGNALLGASTVLVYLSNSSLESEHCNREINLALDEGKTVVPVYLEPVDLPPDLKIGLNRLQALNADPNEGHRTPLLSVLGQMQSAEIKIPQPRHGNRHALAIAMAIVLAVAAGSWLFFAGGNESAGSRAAQNLYDRSFQTDDLAEKIEVLEQVLVYDPEFLDARAELGYMLIEAAELGTILDLQVFHRARSEALKVLASDPQHAIATTVMARSYLQLDLNANKALEAFSKAEDYGADPGRVATFKAAIFLNSGEYDLAVTTIKEAHDLNPENEYIAEFYARCLYLQGSVDASWQMFDKAIELNPRFKNTAKFALLMAAARGDAPRMRNLIQRIPSDAITPLFGKPLLAAVEGDLEPMRTILKFSEDNRAQYGDRSAMFAEGYWWAEEYQKHINWFEIRERENDTLYFVNFNLAVKPNYWEKLKAWSVAMPDKTEERTKQLVEHQNRIERITAKMAL